ncbi:MAG TPA: AI-2E family transporter [Patescibacteria group bacterium]|jgi:predicted PurR-regulated permease PerM|nr:AI-2E family transporter [Patescibacteria group bacterium]
MAQYKRLQTISFLVLLLLVFVLVLFIFKPFVNIVAFGLILAILFGPVHKHIVRAVKNPNLAAGLTILLIMLIILVPIWFFGQIIFNEIGNLYNNYKSGGFVIDKSQIISTLPVQIQNAIQNFSTEINAYIGHISSQAFSYISFIVSNVASFIIAAFMTFFIVFFLLRDGKEIKEAIMDVSPISTAHEDKLFERIVGAVNGVVKGAFMMAIIQGCVATIGFFIFGVPQPLLWGLFTILAALVPTIGTSLAIIPAIIYLLVTGQTPQAIGMAIWGFTAVALIDNFVGPRVVGSRVKLHPVLVLFSIIGGLEFFGPLGFLIGPIVMAIFIELVDMYRTDFKDQLSQ